MSFPSHSLSPGAWQASKAAKLEEKKADKEARIAERARVKAEAKEAKSNQPKKPRSSYLLFCKATRTQIAEQAVVHILEKRVLKHPCTTQDERLG